MLNNAGKVGYFIISEAPSVANNPPAEAALREEEKKAGFSIQLLQITASGSYPANTRLASAIYFKNLVRNQWVVGASIQHLLLEETTDRHLRRTKMATLNSRRTKLVRLRTSSLVS